MTGKIFCIISISIFAVSDQLHAQTHVTPWENRNMIITNEILYPGILTQEDVDKAPIGKKKQSVVYFDGLGRPEQTVMTGASPGKKDMIIPVEYDLLGREAKQFLPYVGTTGDGLFRTNAITSQGTYLGDPVNGVYKGENHFYTETQFDNSPLNLPVNTMAPGSGWGGSGKGVKLVYDLNGLDDKVRIWRMDGTDINALPVSGATDIFPAYTLAKKITTDENGKQTVEYANTDNQVVLKKQQIADNGPLLTPSHDGWLCTYYVYDDLNRLRFVITPKAVEPMSASSNWAVTQDVANGLCYRYVNDGKGRVIEKKLPDRGITYLVYDNRDRVVFSQDGNQQAAKTASGSKEWSFFLYDSQNRTTASGVMVDNSNYTRAALQSIVDNPAYQFGERILSVTTDKAETIDTWNPVPLFPAAGPAIAFQEIKMNTISRYDEQAVTAFTAVTLGYADNYENMEPATPSKFTRGLQTSTTARVLDQNGNTYLHSTILYDDKGRVLQTASTNYQGNPVRSTNQYDFTGKVRSTNYTESKSLTGGGSDIYKIISKMEFDHADRLLATKKNFTRTYRENPTTPEVITTSGDKNMVAYEYDELGRMINKTLSPGYNNPNGNNYLEKLTYDYNVRGWITGINKGFVKGTTTGSLFGMELGYDKGGSAGFVNTALNGNVAGMAWKSIGDKTARKYDYTYDNANRLASAAFTQQNTAGANWTNDKYDFSVPVMQYDANGNIKRMEQQGVTITGIVPMDKLNYEYQNNSNQLNAVFENAPADYKLNDFMDKNAGSGNKDYGYDENGNTTQDLNKGITAIKYNMLDLPQELTFDNNRGTVKYVYDAAGNKLQKNISGNINGVAQYSYSGPLVFSDNDFSIAFEDGRVRLSNAGQTPAFTYDYYIKDHLGNVRMVLTEDLQTDPYLPATMETATAAVEDQLYTITNRTDKPADLQNNTAYDARYGQKMSRLSALAGAQKIGPSIILKVMSGDVVHAKTDYYYKDNGTQQNRISLLGDLAGNLVTMLTGGAAGGAAKVQASAIGANAQLDNVVQNLITNQNNTYNNQRPKAYLNYIVFDEQFQAKTQGAIQVQNSGPLQAPLPLTNIPIDQNGWIYVFVNNESEQPVYFDNFQVTHVRGNLLEENHYYPFGLTMARISPKALGFGAPENKIRFQGQELQNKEFNDGSGLETYQFRYRMDDPQIGRFWQIDPLAEKYVYNSTYAFSENKVTGHVELEGLESFSIQDLWRGAGITSSSDPKQFVKNLGTELTKPKTWIQGAAGAGQIVGPVFLTTLMTGGFGDVAILGAETNALRTTLSTTPSETTTLFRAGSFGEVTDMLNNGVRNIPGQYETGKLFATTAQDAAQYGKFNFGLDGIPNWIVEVKVPNSAMQTAVHFEADGMQAVNIQADQLHTIKWVKPLNYTPKPSNPFNLSGW